MKRNEVGSTQTKDIPVVILAGGLGTRLREETERVPKPLVQIGERPMLWHIMKLYRHHGFRRFIVCLGYKGYQIKEFFLNYREEISDLTVHLGKNPHVVFEHVPDQEDWSVTCAETGLLTGTGGRLSRVRDYIDTDTFLFTYGDGIGNVNIKALMAHHEEQGRVATVTAVRPTSRYGEMRVGENRVQEFNEKPTKADGHVSGGFFVFQREFLDYVTDDVELFLEGEPLQNVARDGQLSYYVHDGFWLGMDTYRDFTELNDRWREGKAPWKVWEQ
jgi:glucose-1-phosphate cytidylyltransferase